MWAVACRADSEEESVHPFQLYGGDTMRIEIRGNVDLTQALGQYVERRFHAALGRFSKRLPVVIVRLMDENGPKGGVDKRCQVMLSMPPATSMMVDEVHADLYTAIDLAADRASRAVTRELGRRRAKRNVSAELRNAEKTGRYTRGLRAAS
jgi:ribosomal subunit interface protein